jgi:hypothetical protein
LQRGKFLNFYLLFQLLNYLIQNKVIVKKEEPIEVQSSQRPAVKVERELEDIILLEDIPFNQLPINKCQASINSSLMSKKDQNKNKHKTRVDDSSSLQKSDSNPIESLSRKNGLVNNDAIVRQNNSENISNEKSNNEQNNSDLLSEKKRPSVKKDDQIKRRRLSVEASKACQCCLKQIMPESNRCESRRSIPNNTTPKSSKSGKSRFKRIISFECKDLSIRDPRLDRINSNAGYLGMRKIVVDNVDLKEIVQYSHQRSESSKEWTCNVCHVKVPANEKQIQIHLSGKNHFRKSRFIGEFDESDLKPPLAAGEPESTSPKWKCPICNVLMDEASLADHLKSERHRRNLHTDPIILS